MDPESAGKRCLAHIDKDRTLGRTGTYDIRESGQSQYGLAHAFAVADV
jgi:hypothetical protein